MADVELVIKIPEEMYEIIQDSTKYIDEVARVCEDAVSVGTPLPKGHGRLIDADELISNICGNSCGCHLEECGYDNPCYSVTRISSASTIIAGKEVLDADNNLNFS